MLKANLPQFLLPEKITSGFQQIKTKHAKSQEKNKVWGDKAIFRTRLKCGTDVGFIREFKITMINILWILMKHIDTMKVHMCNWSGGMETMKESKGTSRSKKREQKWRIPFRSSSAMVTQLRWVNSKKGQ